VRERTLRTWIVALGVAAIVVAANASEGAYFSQSWGWVGIAFAFPVAFVLIAGTARRPGRLRAAFAIAMTLLAAWIALSALWSLSSASSIRELERVLVYVLVALAVALVLRRGDAPAVAGGVALGVVAVSTYALATRLFPDRFETFDDPIQTYRLSEPVGYWNALGLLAALGVLLVLGIAANARRTPYAASAAAALPVLATTVYFTFSRGAWWALAAALIVLVALDPRRLRLVWTGLVLAVPSVLAVALASRQDALTTEDSPLPQAISEGHRLAAWIVVLVPVSAGLVWAARTVGRRVAVSPAIRRAFDVVLLAVLVAALVGVVVSLGGPVAAVNELEDRFDAPVAAVGSNDLNERLFSISGNGRAESVDVAVEAGRERPWAGHGAGSYEYLWYERRPSDLVIRDAHSLYAEVFAELGLVGLLLLGAVIVVTVVAGIRARRNPLAPAATAAFVAWAAASALDWHWEVVGVTMSALLCAGVGLVAAERRRLRPLPAGARWGLFAAVAAATCFMVVSVVGNQALFAGREALARREWATAMDHAERANDLLLWSYEPELVLGDAAAGLGRRADALAHFRAAANADPENWVVWLRVAQVEQGPGRAKAYERVRELNPREDELPGASPGG
jgi:O-antigen ligase